MKINDGFTLIEMMMVVLVFAFLFAAIFTVLGTADRSWRLGQNKLTEQQEARRAVGTITRLLRQSNPEWIINGIPYRVDITDDGKKISFYQPIFDLSGNISSLKKITFKLNPDDVSQLLKKEGTSTAGVVANNVESLNFGGGCPGCSAFNCSTVADDCPVVAVNIVTKKRRLFELEHQSFNLSSQVTLRNKAVPLSDDTVIEQPAEGEF